MVVALGRPGKTGLASKVGAPLRMASPPPIKAANFEGNFEISFFTLDLSASIV
jgi:hypothetical protein